MAVEFPPKVNAGDLIRSQHWNQMVDVLTDLAVKVAALEASTGSSGVNITSVTSSTSPIRVGSRITVNGTGFVMPAALNNVTVGSATIPGSAFAFASDATHLIFDVPPQSPAPAVTGTITTLSVVNANGSDTTSFLLHPAEQVPSGTIAVSYASAPVMPDGEPNITANRSYIFTFNIITDVDLPASYSVVPNLTGQASWSVQFLEDLSDNVRASSIIPIPGGANVTTPVRMRVTLPVGASGAGVLVINVTPAAPGTGITSGMSSPITVAVGSPPPTPETRARITLRSAMTAGRVQLSRLAPAGVNLNLIATDNGLFNMTGVFRNASAGTVNPITSVNIAGASPGTPVGSPFTAVVNPAGTALETDLIVTVRRGSPVNLQVEYWVPIRFV